MSYVLIVDDKEENVYYLTALLTGAGWAVQSAHNGADALALARQSAPALVISDLLMPVMDGYTLLRNWRADPRLKSVPFIVYTATYTEPEDERLALRLGADAFILKPSEPQDFLARMREVQAKLPATHPPSPKLDAGDEKEMLEVYSKTLIRKLEEKTLQLQESNRALQEDIAARKKVEEELRWKTAFLEAQVDSSIDGILVVDGQGRKILQNQRLTDLWKIPREIVENKDDAVQVAYVASKTKTPERFADKIAFLRSQSDEITQDEIELVDGTILDRCSSPIRDKGGKYYGRIWAFRDITQHRKLEAQLRQSQKMEAFGQLAGGVAHDFNNILMVIQLQAEFLKSEENLSLKQLDCASEIEKAAQRATNLTRQLLLFSREQTMQPHDLDLREVVESIAEMLRRALGDHIRLRFTFCAGRLFVHADAGMMDQILLNLAVNARDAMPKGGEIRIELSTSDFGEAATSESPHARHGSFICLSVTDSGTGIAPEVLPRIFEPFFTTKEVGKGTGLGLATVFGIVQQHKGWIEVDTFLGRGTTFRVYLPRLATGSEWITNELSPAPLRGGGETILLVEDDDGVRLSVTAALSRLGYHVLKAPTATDALSSWEQNQAQIHLLMTDLLIPGGLTGMDLAQKLLSDNAKLKVIYTSGYSAEIAGRNIALEEGVNFLTKPFDTQKLARTIRNCLDR